jgi:hypothetical protein
MSEPKEQLMPTDHLIQEWESEWRRQDGYPGKGLKSEFHRYLCSKAAQWGANQELGSCCDLLEEQCWPRLAKELRETRRPKRPSLKEQALEALETADIGYSLTLTPAEASIVRRALEALPNE